jgi:hypothetical protein
MNAAVQRLCLALAILVERVNASPRVRRWLRLEDDDE